MDLSKFSDPEFDPKKWVNAALKVPKDSKTPLDVHASTLVMKLQLFIQEVSNTLEDTSNQVVQGLPRVLRDVESVRQEALLLREQMQVVKDDIKKVETDTSQSMKHLVDLDSVKSRMLDSKNALQEADNWTQLLCDVEEVFASGDVSKISEKLIRMQQSLNVLHDVPDYEERRKLLESLKNRLEALLSPKLITAFNNHYSSEAQQYVEVFSGIDREQRVRGYYVQCHKNSLQQVWTSLQDPSQPLLQRLSSFYDELFSKWQEEYSWCQQVFPQPLSMLSKLFSESMEALHPPMNQCLHTSVHRSQSPIDTLIDLRSCMLRFIDKFQKTLSTESYEGGVVYSLVEALHMPYCQLLVQFGSFEQQLLVEKLKEMKLSGAAGPEELLQSLAGSISRVFSLSGTALEHCQQLTDGWAISTLIKTIETYFSQYLRKFSAVVQDLKQCCSSHSQTTQSGNESKDEQQDMWVEFEWAFKLIQYCGEVHLRATAFNQQLCGFVFSKSEAFKSPAGPSNPFGSFDYLCLYHPEEHTAVMELLAAVEKGGKGYQLLPHLTNQIRSLTDNVFLFAYNILFSQLQQKLSHVPHLKVWSTGAVSPLESPRGLTSDLPLFSLSPLTYITEIGDYLLTLPQQLEPFASQDNNPAIAAALKLGTLPHSTSGEGEADVWLGAVVQGTMEAYTESILLIPSLDEAAAQQLVTDIGYLCNVFAALGHSPSPSLVAMEMMFKADKNQFALLKNNLSIPKHLYQTVSRLMHWH